MNESLYKKWIKLVEEVSYVQKSGTNAYHKYSYVTEEDLLDLLRPKMAELGLLFFPASVSIVEEATSGDLITLKYQYKLVDVDTGESEIIEVVSAGADSGDKGAFKAATGARKYALRQLVLVSTGDDPERDEDSLDSKVKNKQAITVIRKLQRAGFLPLGGVLKSDGYSEIENAIGMPIHNIPDTKDGTSILRSLFTFAADFEKNGKANYGLLGVSQNN